MGQETYLILGINESIGSKEEFEFLWWLIEGTKAGLIEPDWKYHPKTFTLAESQYVTQTTTKQLKTKVKVTTKEKSILQGVEYTPDFTLKVTPRFYEVFPNMVNYFMKPEKDGTIWIDTKGGFSGPHNNSAITFPIKQKWLYQKTGIYVQKLIPKTFFKKNWVPLEAALTPKKRERSKTFEKCKLLTEIKI